MIEFKNNTFKIMQIADTQDGCKISRDTLNLIECSLEKEKPDFVVFSGDQIWGNSFHGDEKKVENALRCLTYPVVRRKIPFTVCFGNHDEQTGISKEKQLEIYKKIPFFVGENSEGIDGCLNHFIEITDNGKTEFVLYFIDSHGNLDVGYDNVHLNQIEWYKSVRDSFEKKYSHVVPSVVFQHIPVPEVFELLIEKNKKTRTAVQGFRNHKGKWYTLNKNLVNDDGFMGESPADPTINSSEFDAMNEKGDVKAIFFGHDHNNSFIGKYKNILLGYTQGAGFHTYGPGKKRGVRIIELEKGGNIDTYDVRFNDVCPKGVADKLNYALWCMSPTNLYDGVSRGLKIIAVGTVGILTVKAIKAIWNYLAPSYLSGRSKPRPY